MDLSEQILARRGAPSALRQYDREAGHFRQECRCGQPGARSRVLYFPPELLAVQTPQRIASASCKRVVIFPVGTGP